MKWIKISGGKLACGDWIIKKESALFGQDLTDWPEYSELSYSKTCFTYLIESWAGKPVEDLRPQYTTMPEVWRRVSEDWHVITKPDEVLMLGDMICKPIYATAENFNAAVEAFAEYHHQTNQVEGITAVLGLKGKKMKDLIGASFVFEGCSVFRSNYWHHVLNSGKPTTTTPIPAAQQVKERREGCPKIEGWFVLAETDPLKINDRVFKISKGNTNPDNYDLVIGSAFSGKTILELWNPSEVETYAVYRRLGDGALDLPTNPVARPRRKLPLNGHHSSLSPLP